MEILKINDQKVKIMLTSDDVRRFGLDINDVDYADSETRSKIWSVLDASRASWSFESGEDKLLVQFYPSRDGGAELFVTKLGRINKKGERRLISSEEVTLLQARREIYRFGNLDTLLLAARVVSDCPYIKESELYYSEDGSYYLFVLGRGGAGHGGIAELSVLLEYSERVGSGEAARIAEHSRVLIERRAVSTLSEL